jgi:hypothetical protein
LLILGVFERLFVSPSLLFEQLLIFGVLVDSSVMAAIFSSVRKANSESSTKLSILEDSLLALEDFSLFRRRRRATRFPSTSVNGFRFAVGMMKEGTCEGYASYVSVDGESTSKQQGLFHPWLPFEKTITCCHFAVR